NFRSPTDAQACPTYISHMFEGANFDYPVLINEVGQVIDGQRRVLEAQKRGITSLLCNVRHITDEKEAKILRVSVNNRLHKVDKLNMYWSICTLANLGLSQQKIADALGTSRTNVIVYTKVKDKATSALRKLFEDGMIQITNASSCVDFTEKTQDRIASFVRTYGASWGKGSQFTELYTAASNSKLAQLEKKAANNMPLGSSNPVVANTSIDAGVSAAETKNVPQIDQELRSYQQSLRDAEVWTAQRESVIARQTEELSEAKTEIEALKKELEALELIQYGDKSTVQEILKEFKDFYALTERVAGAAQAARQAGKQVRQTQLSRKQVLEVQEIVDQLEQHVNVLRVELTNKAGIR
ncbi:MAG: hypothetical protein OXQ96_00100, partial [Alphaproteobacteria bacterium]|nr:hypothetical protein [Alphaproteobacteria bacterium]